MSQCGTGKHSATGETSGKGETSEKSKMSGSQEPVVALRLACRACLVRHASLAPLAHLARPARLALLAPRRSPFASRFDALPGIL